MPKSNRAAILEIREIDRDAPIYPGMLTLRKAVLRNPLGLEYSDADLAAETDQRHFVLVYPEMEDVIGCALLVEKPGPVANIRQVAISETIRGTGLGRMLMTDVEDAAWASGFTEIQLHARETAVPFYERIGYEIVGERFIEIGLPHFLMRKRKR